MDDLLALRLGVARSGWRPDLHPRDRKGEFASTPGGTVGGVGGKAWRPVGSIRPSEFRAGDRVGGDVLAGMPELTKAGDRWPLAGGGSRLFSPRRNYPVERLVSTGGPVARLVVGAGSLREGDFVPQFGKHVRKVSPQQRRGAGPQALNIDGWTVFWQEGGRVTLKGFGAGERRLKIERPG